MDEDRLGRLCFRMAQDSAISGNTDRALDELEEMLYHFNKMSEFSHIDHTSLLINVQSCDKTEIRKKDEENIYSTFLHYLNKRSKCFEYIADEPRYIAIKEQLQEKSNR